ncbi:glycosyl transferase family 1 [Mycolicibacterium chubuense]|uniref:D-inositol-3-phosphate glycosyltransferase n=1 Tax=Mycolicibacterium chubuense TaxID=1800 RepID=A0A0J6WLH1_MYCCU|nr:D-inositol-3-phosphate glycosyltransferase [Mycolicibacterium chubuense]ORA43332.1 glycosyl transferase family 1 [Mycolicibacterium chubuense]SPX99776.1 group 1 glycosyl transferase [Mycolicibacterium chubuense]
MSASHALPMSRPVRFGVLSTFAPTLCGVARFSAGLSDALRALGNDVDLVRIADDAETESPDDELVNGSAASVAACAARLNLGDVAIIQHQYGLYGGTHGDEVLSLIEALRVPSVLVAHEILEHPRPHERWVMERMVAMTDRVIVMSAAARTRLCRDYGVEPRKVVLIPHGGTVFSGPRLKRPSRPTILTWGMLAPGKGIERVIDVMSSLQSVAGRPRYVVVGQTDPREAAVHGDAYREACIDRARRNGVADSVSFDPRSYNRASLTALIQSSSVVVLPYDSTDQVSSAILVEAIANGRPVVATPFPHAVELLSGGAGILVDHDDSDGLASALRQILTQPRLAGAMAAEARQLAPDFAWSAVGGAYTTLGQRLVAERAVAEIDASSAPIERTRPWR